MYLLVYVGHLPAEELIVFQQDLEMSTVQLAESSLLMLLSCKKAGEEELLAELEELLQSVTELEEKKCLNFMHGPAGLKENKRFTTALPSAGWGSASSQERDPCAVRPVEVFLL